MATAKKKAAPAKKKVAPKKKAAVKKAAPVKKVPCSAKTTAGTKCKKMAVGKSKFCASHKK
jgi:hypothetical protein